MKCPICETPLLSENINIQTDVARCHNCNHIFKLSERLDSFEDGAFDIDNPPKGASITKDIDSVKICVSTRSPFALFLVPFMIVWSGGALGGIYGTQIMNNRFELFPTIIGIPFILGALFFWSITLMAIWGKVEVIFDKTGGTIFTGLGKLGTTKKFIWSEIEHIIESKATWNGKSTTQQAILMQGASRISFGSGLNSKRKYYLLRALQVYHNKIKNRRSL